MEVVNGDLRNGLNSGDFGGLLHFASNPVREQKSDRGSDDSPRDAFDDAAQMRLAKFGGCVRHGPLVVGLKRKEK